MKLKNYPQVKLLIACFNGIMDATLFNKYQLQVKTKAQEWGDLLVFFADNLNEEINEKPFYIDANGKKKKLTKWTPPRVGLKICHLKKGDDLSAIYYLKSICTDAKLRKESFGKVFNGSLKAKNVDRH